MKKIAILSIIVVSIIVTGCDTSHNFMDVDNVNAKKDLEILIGSGNIPKIDAKDIIPDSLSGARDSAKGYAEKYYSGKVEGYVDKAKQGLSGASETLKGFYNDGVDNLNEMVSDKVNGVISGELNKFKIK